MNTNFREPKKTSFPLLSWGTKGGRFSRQLVRVSVGLGLGSLSLLQGAEIPFVARPDGVFPVGKLENFLGFSGVASAPEDSFANEMGMGWVRNDLVWSEVHTAPGVYDWAAGGFDEFITKANEQGLKVVIMVRNTPGWARTTSPYDFVTPGQPQTPGGEHWYVTPNAFDGNGFPQGFRLERYAVADNSLILDSQYSTATRLRLSDSQDFVDFMLAAVARYSAPPYNVKYFQIGNEHRPESGQYPLDTPAGMAEHWFLPAALAIHAAYPDVTLMDCFPGNTTAAQLMEFETYQDTSGNEVLDHLGVHVHHYGDVGRWDVDWARYESYGIDDMPHWATEYGSVFTQTVPGRWKVSHSYPEILAHCLLHDWDSDVDKYKIQFWPYGGSSAGDKALVFSGNTLSDHGRQIRALYALLHGNTFQLHQNVTSSPDAAANDYLYAFDTDTGVVIAVGLDDWSPGNTIDISVGDLPPSQITFARAVDAFGTVLQTLSPVASGGGSILTVDLTLLPESSMEMVYLQLGLTDTAAPSAPTGLAALVDETKIALDWSDNAESSVIGYNIYRSTTMGGPYTKINQAVQLASQFVDVVPEAGTFFYVVRAANALPIESADSAEVSASPIILYVDNADVTGVIKTGNWTTTAATPGYYGTNYLHEGNTGTTTDKSVRFTPDLPEAGNYKIYARWTSGANRASNVPIEVTDTSGVSYLTVDQQLNGGSWVLLGTFDFNAGTSGNVLVRNQGANGYVIADAVQFVKTTDAAQILLSNLGQLYDGTPKPAAATTTPEALNLKITYDGRDAVPVAPGNYTVSARIVESGHRGSASGVLQIFPAAVVKHAPTLDGSWIGSLQVLSAESFSLNGSATITGDLLLPGLPAVTLNGTPNFAGVIDGSGNVGSATYQITLNSGATLNHLVRRTDASPLPSVFFPAQPIGTANVTINTAGESPGSFAVLRDLTLNNGVGHYSVPPGNYGNFTVNGASGLILGEVGATEPASYSWQQLILNSGALVQIVGPVILNLASELTVNATLGDVAHPEWLSLNIAAGGLTLNSGARVYARVKAPHGRVTLSGGSELHGSLACDRLTVNSGGSFVPSGL